VPSLTNEIDDRPALLPTLQAIQRKFRKLAPAQTTPEQDGQDRSITLSGQSLSIGYLPERRCLACCKPVARREPSLRTPLTRWMPAAKSGLNSPQSAASYANRRTAAIRTLIVPGARPRSS
jgi:hypothetical protein